MKHYTINRLGQVLKRTHNSMTKTVGAYYGPHATELLERLRAEAINVPDAEQIARNIIIEFTQSDAMSALGRKGGSAKSDAKTAAARKNAGHVSDKTRKERSERMKARHAYRKALLALHEDTAMLMNPASGSVQSWEDWKTDQKAEKWPIEELRSLAEVK